MRLHALADAQFRRSTKEGRVDVLERLVHDRAPTGVLAYLDQEPVGWCPVAPRAAADR